MASTSVGFSRSVDSTVAITWLSKRQPFGNSGRLGRSIRRAVSISASVRRPSRLKYPPGILPAAEVFSRYSQVSGRKSIPGRIEVAATAVTSTIESPYRITTDPSACLAIRPVSMVSSWVPKATPSRTNIAQFLLQGLRPLPRRPRHPFVPHLEGRA